MASVETTKTVIQSNGSVSIKNYDGNECAMKVTVNVKDVVRNSPIVNTMRHLSTRHINRINVDV